MVADKEYDVECEIDCQAAYTTKNEDAVMTKQRVDVDQDPTKIPDDEGNIKPSSTKRKKHKKKKKTVTIATACELGDDDDVKVVGEYDNDRSCMTTSAITTTRTTTSTRIPSKKPIILQRGLLSTAYMDDYIKYGQIKFSIVSEIQQL